MGIRTSYQPRLPQESAMLKILIKKIVISIVQVGSAKWNKKWKNSLKIISVHCI